MVQSAGKADGRLFIVAGPPNAGKGTQTNLLAERLGAAHFSTGELLRKEKNPRIMAIINAGGLAPSGHIRSLIYGAISEVPLSRPIVLDGAKKLEEARWLLDLLPSMGRRLESVIFLSLSEEESRKRSLDREASREDDAVDVQDERWRRYRSEVLPTIDFYRSLGVLVEVDAWAPREEVADRVWAQLGWSN